MDSIIKKVDDENIVNKIYYSDILNYRERDILAMINGLYGYYQYSYDEVSKKYGITTNRVRQIEKNALEKIRDVDLNKIKIGSLQEVFLKRVKNNGLELRFAPEKIKNDISIFLPAVKQNFDVILLVSEELKKDYLELLNIDDYDHKSPYYDEYYDDERYELQSKSRLLKNAPEEIKNDREIVLAIIKKDPIELKYVKEEFKNDKDIVIAAVTSDGNALRYASEELKNDKDIVIAAVTSDSSALRHASARLQNNHDVLDALYTAHPDYGKNWSPFIELSSHVFKASNSSSESILKQNNKK